MIKLELGKGFSILNKIPIYFRIVRTNEKIRKDRGKTTDGPDLQ